jgi:endonuclease/exonuclease/phosphatase family metal-dependent hydrolase
MRHVFYILCLCLFAAGCQHDRKPEIPTEPNVSIMTYNVHWPSPSTEPAVDIISAENPDIVCLQETTERWEFHIREGLRDKYPYMEFRSSSNKPTGFRPEDMIYLGQRRTGGGYAFLSKYPFTEVAFIPSDTGWWDGWIAAFTTPIGRFQIYNVHLHPPLDEAEKFSISGYFSSKKFRLNEIKRYYSNRDPNLPLIAAGDYNETDKGKAVRFLKDNGLTDALSQFVTHTYTWRMNFLIFKLRETTDHIMYEPYFYCYSSRVIKKGTSDHFPVVAVFGIKDRQQPVQSE